MKRLFGKIKYRLTNDSVTAELFAPLKSTGKLALFGRVHSGAIPHLKTKSDFEKNMHVIRIEACAGIARAMAAQWGNQDSPGSTP